MLGPKPAAYDDLDAALRDAWARLAQGCRDRRSPFHTPALASTGLDGRPRARIVVLRACEGRTLRFHTDRRSDKAAELRAEPRVSLLGYDAGAKVQVRVEGRASLHLDDAVADAAWGASRPFSRVCYGTSPAPGSTIPAGGAFALPSDDAAVAAGRTNFAAVVVTAQLIEWLYLDHDGHRRARFDLAEGTGTWRGTWLAP